MSLTGHQAQGHRRHQKRPRSRLPRRLPRPQQDLRKARHRILGLPRITAPSAKPPRCPSPAANHQAPLRHSVTATTFAPLTEDTPMELAMLKKKMVDPNTSDRELHKRNNAEPG